MGDALLRKRENRGSVSLIFESDKSQVHESIGRLKGLVVMSVKAMAAI